VRRLAGICHHYPVAVTTPARSFSPGIPFLLALPFYDSWRRARSWALLAPLVGLWLLFLPNAPYLVTDLVHLGTIPGAPLWYDGAMISAFAATGLLLGLASVFLVHAVALRGPGPRLGWAVPVAVLGLCSAGVVVGRFGRLNSSDVLVRPDRLAKFVARHLTDPLASGRALMLTAAYAGFLVIAYVVLYAASSLRPDPLTERRR
jgi:uncharacterized membrane protein